MGEASERGATERRRRDAAIAPCVIGRSSGTRGGNKGEGRSDLFERLRKEIREGYDLATLRPSYEGEGALGW
jgi:hypothetical protein